MKIGAVVVSYNSAIFLRDCLSSLLHQEKPLKAIVIVDNHSQDGSQAILEGFPGVRVLKLEENIGYAAAANRGIGCLDTDAIIVANADTTFPPEFSRRVAQELDADPEIGMLSPLLLRFDNETIDSAGQACSLALYPREIGYNRPLARQPLASAEVFSVCGAATVFTREALSRLCIDGECYDEDFFMFWEDFDIGWRAQLLGIKVIFCPQVVATHFRSGTMRRGWMASFSLALSRPPSIRFHLVKNRYLSLVKNFRWRRDWKSLPFIMAKDLVWIGALTLSHPKNIMALMHSGILFRRALAKRKRIQAHE